MMQELPELPKHDNYDEYLEEPLLEYIVELCDKICPNIDFDEDGEAYLLSSLAPRTFALRYYPIKKERNENGEVIREIELESKIDTSFKSKYENDVWIKRTLEKLSYNKSKFWYLLLFIKDYVLTTKNNSYAIGLSEKEQLQILVGLIAQNCGGNGSYNDMKVSISINNVTKFTIDNVNVLRYLGISIADKIKEIEYGSIMANSPLTAGATKLSNTAMLWLFKNTFDELLPKNYPTGKAIGKETFVLGKNSLIARLFYISGLSNNESFMDWSKAGKVLANTISSYSESDVDRHYNIIYSG
ncbi:hypothetical protein [Bacteroides sp. 51]|uniref:hypothetical protein n=1 Tax=Bacteroides sp. 51 TaxID=2302938 RepID=UPI0013D87B82|nr:hypothetical protein [Bacteroides sp. 51]NDV83374.1 hypothetical protein [Bacteroides sp. 51]